MDKQADKQGSGCGAHTKSTVCGNARSPAAGSRELTLQLSAQLPPSRPSCPGLSTDPLRGPGGSGGGQSDTAGPRAHTPAFSWPVPVPTSNTREGGCCIRPAAGKPGTAPVQLGFAGYRGTRAARVPLRQRTLRPGGPSASRGLQPRPLSAAAPEAAVRTASAPRTAAAPGQGCGERGGRGVKMRSGTESGSRGCGKRGGPGAAGEGRGEAGEGAGRQRVRNAGGGSRDWAVAEVSAAARPERVGAAPPRAVREGTETGAQPRPRGGRLRGEPGPARPLPGTAAAAGAGPGGRAAGAARRGGATAGSRSRHRQRERDRPHRPHSRSPAGPGAGSARTRTAASRGRPAAVAVAAGAHLPEPLRPRAAPGSARVPSAAAPQPPAPAPRRPRAAPYLGSPPRRRPRSPSGYSAWPLPAASLGAALVAPRAAAGDLLLPRGQCLALQQAAFPPRLSLPLWLDVGGGCSAEMPQCTDSHAHSLPAAAAEPSLTTHFIMYSGGIIPCRVFGEGSGGRHRRGRGKEL